MLFIYQSVMIYASMECISLTIIFPVFLFYRSSPKYILNCPKASVQSPFIEIYRCGNATIQNLFFGNNIDACKLIYEILLICQNRLLLLHKWVIPYYLHQFYIFKQHGNFTFSSQRL